jgi:MFS family permease
MIPFVLLAEYYSNFKENACINFNYHNKDVKPSIIILLAVLVVIVRGYMGYGIPTSWNKTTIELILLYTAMGLGKALGGILSDSFGIRKIAIISVLFSLPFLLFGDNIMLLSLMGIAMFSMTMSITLTLLVSVLKNKPGLAFGLTTIGLFLGSVPIFFIKLVGFIPNAILIVICSIICLLILLHIIRRDNNEEC